MGSSIKKGILMGQIKEKIMIVDDSMFQRTVLRGILEKSFDLIEVESGEKCLKMFEEGFTDVDMVLLDIVMAGIDGFEVLRRRQDMEYFKNIPVIVLTTSESDVFQTDAFELGASEYIEKPIDEKVALTRIKNIADAGRRMKKLLQKQEELRAMSEIDGMTKLFNKTMIEKIVNNELAKNNGSLHAFMAIDIDNFKAVNDIFGHKTGDHTISVVAGVLSSNFSDTDYIGRIGGDEFIVMMSNIESRDIALSRAEKLVSIIKEKENLTIPENISLSIGVAFSDEKDRCYADLFGKADEALYAAKKAGKGCYFAYGTDAESDGEESHGNILAYNISRNAESILKFVLSESVRYESFESLDDIGKRYAQGEHADAVFIDVSSMTDSGKAVWRDISICEWAEKMTVIAICQEGSMEQIRVASDSGIVTDIIFAPLNEKSIERRMRAHGILK